MIVQHGPTKDQGRLIDPGPDPFGEANRSIHVTQRLDERGDCFCSIGCGHVVSDRVQRLPGPFPVVRERRGRMGTVLR